MAFEPLRTERLVIRPVRSSDAEALAERRSDPAVAEFQNWSGAYSLDRARALIGEILADDEPPDDGWWMLTIEDRDGTIIGDLALHPTWSRRCAEIGYTLARSAWGQGYAVEAVEALVEHLWEWPGLTRIHATLHPDNVASAQVLERTGFRFEGRTRLSYWVEDENSDDAIYGMTRTDWTDWVQRPQDSPDTIRLLEIDERNQMAVAALTTHESQRRFVADVNESYADSLFVSDEARRTRAPWLRAVEADGELAGFVMVALPHAAGSTAEPYLWRLLIDRRHQRRGIGSMVIDEVIELARRLGAASLTVAWEEGRGSPAPVYLAKGFVPTGEIEDGEIVARLPIDPGDAAPL